MHIDPPWPPSPCPLPTTVAPICTCVHADTLVKIPQAIATVCKSLEVMKLRACTIANSMVRACLVSNLQVVVSAECLAAHRASKEHGAKQDLGWCRDPILPVCELLLPYDQVLRAAIIAGGSTPGL